MATGNTTKRQRQREKHHANFRTLETELHNELAHIDVTIGRVKRAAEVRDCATARLNFNQALVAFKKIRPKLDKLQALARKLGIAPGTVIQIAAAPPASAPKPAAAAPPPRPPRKSPVPPPRPAPAPAPKPAAKKKPAKAKKAARR